MGDPPSSGGALQVKATYVLLVNASFLKKLEGGSGSEAPITWYSAELTEMPMLLTERTLNL